MKLQPLDLEGLARDVFDIFDDEEFDLTVSSIKSLIKQRLKSACEFWLKYKDNPERFIKDFDLDDEECGLELTEDKKKVISVDVESGKTWFIDYNDWLFKLVFKSVLEDDK